MLIANLIAKKRDGMELDGEEIRWLIESFCDGSVADYQMSAFAMAVCLRGMTDRETLDLTLAMLASGVRLPRRTDGAKPRVDKHSTGGLGDKVSLILAPLLSACDVQVPMISGRGLGLTGGTLDKLEAIPGFQCDLSESESTRVLDDVGAFIISANQSIAPADRRLYALRDVTGTVESVPLITASILSKKLAASLDALVMDVKVGNAAFMKTMEQAKQLAESISRIGNAAGLSTSVVISDMDQPLGRAVGNALEVNEAVAILAGRDRSFAAVERVRQLSIRLAAELLVRVGRAADVGAAVKRLSTALDDGSAMRQFERMIAAQKGRWSGDLAVAPAHPIRAAKDGYVQRIEGAMIGSAVIEMGGGRRRVGDAIDPAVGITMHVQIGDRVCRDQTLFEIHCHGAPGRSYLDGLVGAVVLTDQPVAARPLLFD